MLKYKYFKLLPSLKNLGNINFNKIPFNDRIKKAFDFYEEVLGIKEVRKTQENVLKTESEFVESSKARRNAQNELIKLQEQLKQIRQKLDSIHRSDEAYLTLITKEHQLIKSELQVLSSLRSLEEQERDLFSKFSQKLRDAHETERLRQEKTKYLSVIGSIVGACLGIIATSINHALKRKDFNEITQLIQNRFDSVQPVYNPTPVETVPLNENTSVPKRTIETQTDSQIFNTNEIVNVISSTESNLEYKMKINSLTTVVTTYALIALTLPIIVRLFTDN